VTGTMLRDSLMSHDCHRAADRNATTITPQIGSGGPAIMSRPLAVPYGPLTRRSRYLCLPDSTSLLAPFVDVPACATMPSSPFGSRPVIEDRGRVPNKRGRGFFP